jgi:hypothetical protein
MNNCEDCFSAEGCETCKAGYTKGDGECVLCPSDCKNNCKFSDGKAQCKTLFDNLFEFAIGVLIIGWVLKKCGCCGKEKSD